MMTKNVDELSISKQELILDFILIFRDPNNSEDDEISSSENLQTWTVIQDKEGFDLIGDRDFAIIKEALAKRFQDLSATQVRESVIVDLRNFES